MLVNKTQMHCLRYSGRNWSREEDDQLKEAIAQVTAQDGCRSWVKVAPLMPGRTAKQCRERFLNQIAPEINRSEMTMKEWDIIVQAQKKFGNCWTKIAKLLPRRSPNWIKNQWNTMLRRSVTSGEDVFSKAFKDEEPTTNRTKRKRNVAADNEIDEHDHTTCDNSTYQIAEDEFSENLVERSRKRTKLAQMDEDTIDTHVIATADDMADEGSSREESSLFEELVNASYEACLQQHQQQERQQHVT